MVEIRMAILYEHTTQAEKDLNSFPMKRVAGQSNGLHCICRSLAAELLYRLSNNKNLQQPSTTRHESNGIKSSAIST